jgi:hypothetical protein
MAKLFGKEQGSHRHFCAACLKLLSPILENSQVIFPKKFVIAALVFIDIADYM